MNTYLELDDYQKSKSRSMLLGIIPFFMLLVLLTFFLLKFVLYDKGILVNGIVDKQGQIKVLLPHTEVNRVIKIKRLKIDKKLYTYKIDKLSDAVSLGDTYFVEVFLTVDLPLELGYENSSFKILFLESSTTIWNQFIKYLKGGN